MEKSQDYQNDGSSVVQAMHYRRGIDTIHDVILGKLHRATSLLESHNSPNFESLEDTYKDIINYCIVGLGRHAENRIIPAIIKSKNFLCISRE